MIVYRADCSGWIVLWDASFGIWKKQKYDMSKDEFIDSEVIIYWLSGVGCLVH